jgi:uncharacterized membrane protein (UPF0127 family)
MSKSIENKRNKKDNNLKSLYLKKYDKKITDIRIADDFFSRLMGLMFREDAKVPLLFEIPQKVNSRKRSSIHSLFMRFDIVLVFIDGNNLVYEIADLAPWNYYVPEKSAKYIVEFDKKEFNNCLKIGDEIEIR